jgi:hypothetical protein
MRTYIGLIRKHDTMQKALLPLAALPFLAGCQGVMWGNVAVLFVTLGIFLGTITLGRPPRE